MTNSLSAFYCVNNCRSLFILIVLSTIPIPRNKTVAATPLIGFNQKSLLFVRVIIPVMVTKTVGTASSIACMITHGQTDFVSLYISTYIMDQQTIRIQPDKSIFNLEIDSKYSFEEPPLLYLSTIYGQ